MILLCYDGSDDAKAAIERAGVLFGGRPATVLAVWEPLVETLARSGAGFGYGSGTLDFEAIDRETEQAALARAQEGVELATAAGLNAQPRARSRSMAIADAILDEADDVAADAIVLGTRGLGGLKSLMLGSVSHALLQHADRPVMVVPSAEVAAQRAAHRRG
ncbi:universal stress protein [Baekduia soli]|uniref:Universal stress protein n=1 Tax=Baekduia soli TaxID=496014 RepID=A0A5B8U0T0_9ACTN|nr:universal stress protein [Baekduia soli]QEC46540.1 universal stress protein [Baekduia soli]